MQSAPARPAVALALLALAGCAATPPPKPIVITAPRRARPAAVAAEAPAATAPDPAALLAALAAVTDETAAYPAWRACLMARAPSCREQIFGGDCTADDACIAALAKNSPTCDAAARAALERLAVADASAAVPRCDAGDATACATLGRRLEAGPAALRYCDHPLALDPAKLAVAQPEWVRTLALGRCEASRWCAPLVAHVAANPTDHDAARRLAGVEDARFADAARTCRALGASTACILVDDFLREHPTSLHAAAARAVLRATAARRRALARREDSAARRRDLEDACARARRGELASPICDGNCPPPIDYVKLCRARGLWR